MVHYADNPSCSTLRDDKKPQVIATNPGMFRNWHRAMPNEYCAECATESRSDSDRYAELRKLVEAVQIDSKLGTARAALDALLDWSHR